MTNSATAPVPEKPKSKLWIIIAFLLTVWGVDHYTFHLISGTDVTVTDSTIVIAPSVDTAKSPAATIDTASKDTTKK